MQIATVTEQLILQPKYWKKPSLRGSPRPKHTNKKWRQNNYYPFGLQHQGYNDIANSCRNEEAEAYKLNGKEYEDSFGLNIYEMDLRQLDPAIGRWTVMDPVVHHDYSPYSAFDNNPVYWSDPSGADSNPSFHLSFQGTEAVHYIFGLIYAMGEINDGQDMIALMNAFDSYEDYVNSIGKTDTNPADENGDGGRDRRRLRQRERNRSRVGSGSLFFDARGQELLTYWLEGSGKTRVLSSNNWAEYMKDNSILNEQIVAELSNYMEKNRKKIMNNSIVNFNITFHGEIENGYFTGYEMLHGSHSGLGDTVIEGSVHYNNKTSMFDFKFKMIWNDKIDPNFHYREDEILSKGLNLLYTPNDYNLKIIWNDTKSIN